MGVVSQGHVCTQSKAAAYGRQMMPQNKETNICALIWMYGVDWGLPTSVVGCFAQL